MRAPFPLFALASLLLATEGCTAILGLDEYKPTPKDGGTSDSTGVDSSGTDTDPGTCEPYAKNCGNCLAKNCVPFWSNCLQPGQDCADLYACYCTCGAAPCITACNAKAPAACSLCLSKNEPTCPTLKCTSDCPS